MGAVNCCYGNEESASPTPKHALEKKIKGAQHSWTDQDESMRSRATTVVLSEDDQELIDDNHADFQQYTHPSNELPRSVVLLKTEPPILSPQSTMMLLGFNNRTRAFSDSESSGGEYFSDDAEDSLTSTPHHISSDAIIRAMNQKTTQSQHHALSDQESEGEEEWKLLANPYIRISVPPGPCGILLQSTSNPNDPPIVEGFAPMLDGSQGAIEQSGKVRRGSMLCFINQIDVTAMPLSEVIRTLNLSSHLEREFTFRDSHHDFDDL